MSVKFESADDVSSDESGDEFAPDTDRKSSKVAMHHMHNYGTFDMDGVHGHLFELQVYVTCLKYHALYYFGFVVLGVTMWPIAAVLAIPLGLLAGRDRILHQCKLLLVTSSIFGVLLTIGPLFLILYQGGITKFYQVVLRQRDLIFIELFEAAYIMVIVVVFAGMYCDIKIATAAYKNTSKRSWARRGYEHGLTLKFHKSQATRLRGFLRHSARERAGLDRNEFFIGDMLHLLESLPGWQACVPSIRDRVGNVHFQGHGIVDELDMVSLEAQRQNLWPIDIWVADAQYYGVPGDERTRLLQGLNVAVHTTFQLMMTVFEYMMQMKLSFVIFLFLSLIRAILPQLWASWALEDPLMVEGALGLVRLYSAFISFVVGMCWMSLLFYISMEYRRTLSQLISFTAMADASRRVEYVQCYLMSCLWYNLDAENSKDVLSRMPLFDLRISSNVVAFWRLREFVTLDRADEYMALSLLIQMVSSYLLLEFLATVFVMFISENIPSLFLVTLFDLVVIGGMILFGLFNSVKVNKTMESHREILAKARYLVAQRGAKEMRSNSMREDDGDDHAVSRGLTRQLSSAELESETCQELLLQYLDMLRESDRHDAILFGVTMTPTKLVSSVFTLAMMISAVITKMITKGHIKAPSEVKEALSHEVAVSFWTAAVNLFSHSNRLRLAHAKSS